MRALFSDRERPFYGQRQRLADEHRVARSSLHETLTRLVGEEQHLRREPDGTPRFVDPLLAHWLVRR